MLHYGLHHPRVGRSAIAGGKIRSNTKKLYKGGHVLED
jgi:hypothetical protein